MAVLISSRIGARTVASWGLKTPRISPSLSNDLRVVRKFSFHSVSENSFITTLSHQSVLRTHIQQEREFRCGDPFKSDDVVVINSSKEEVEKLREKMEEKRAKAKTKKSKKSKAAVETGAAPPESKDETSSTKAGSSVENGNGASSDPDVAGPSSSKSGGASKRSIQEMQDKSEVFKSLFTSHTSAKRTKDQTSNWVTHTPYHF